MTDLQRLSQEFVNYTVVHPTGIERDVIQYCYDFCMENLPGFNTHYMHEHMSGYLTNDATYEGEDIGYFAHEILPDFMDSLSPIGCYYGNHEGESSQGYWQIINTELVMSDFENVTRLPYKRDGYNVLAVDNKGVIDDMCDFDNFLGRYAGEVYDFSDLSEITNITEAHADMLRVFIIDSIMPLLAPKDFEWRINENGNYGLYRQLPTYCVAQGSREYIESVSILRTASNAAKLAYIIDNKQSDKLAHSKDLLAICLDILHGYHFIPLYRSLNKVTGFDKDELAEYLTEHYNALNWVIENLFFDDYKSQVDRILGCQDITRLWIDCLESGVVINGINPEDVWGLRESCEVCEDIEDTDSAEWGDKSCSCCEYDALNNVWLVTMFSFYTELKAHGAMVYETDSYYLYLQTDHAGTHYDTLLRKAWLTDNASAYMGRLQKSE